MTNMTGSMYRFPIGRLDEWKANSVKSAVASVVRWFARFACIAALAGTACTKHGSATPTAPDPAVDPPPSTAPAPPAPTKGAVTITIQPNPVPFSGTPITDTPSCANFANTWFYDQVFQETGGVDVTFHTRADTFDGKPANSFTGLNITVPAHGSVTLHTRWCSGAGIGHTAQSTFSGADAKGDTVSVTGPVAYLNAPGR